MSLLKSVPKGDSGNPITDFQMLGLMAAAGQVDGFSVVHKFGANEDVDIGTEDIWHHGNGVNYPASAAAMNVTSLNANDTSAGTGARTIVIQGLDENWEEAEETVTLNGQTIVTTTTTFIRINRIYVATSGSGDVNAGEIHVFTGTATAGLPDDESLTYGTISADHGQTLQALYTIPAGKTGYLLSGFMSTDAAAKPIQGKMYIRTGADIATSGWRVQFDFKTGDIFQKVYQAPAPIPEKTDIRIEGTADANNTYVSAGFDLLLVDN